MSLDGATLAAILLMAAITYATRIAGLLLAATGVSVAMLALLRPTLIQQVRQMPGYRSSTAKMVGSTGMAMSQIDRSGGEVKVDGQSWSARPYSKASSRT